MSEKFATKFNYYHHSPASTQKPTEIDIFQKLLKARGEPIQYPSVVTVGIAGEEYVKAELIRGVTLRRGLPTRSGQTGPAYIGPVGQGCRRGAPTGP